MKEDILAIRNNLKNGKFVNEASISQGILQRLLFALGWPVYNTDIVSPEYSLQGRRVDFALCHPPNKPIVFIEVKQPGKSEGADRQLFEYAFHVGVPMAILTDGAEWQFYLPAEKGNYSERRVYKLDLVERDVNEIIERLNRYLSYKAICEGTALDAARKDYKDVARKREIENALPEAWRKLIEEADDLLIELLSEKVESLSGYKPDPDTILNFLNKKINTFEQPSTNAEPLQVDSHYNHYKSTAFEISSDVGTFGFEIHGKFFKARSVREVLINVLRELSKLDNTFLERFAALPKHGRTRRFIAKNKNDLYPSRPDLVADYSEKIDQLFWVGTNVGKQQTENIIRLACEVSNLVYGKDIKLFLQT